MGRRKRKRRDVIVGKPKRRILGRMGLQGGWVSRKVRPRSRVVYPSSGSKLPRSVRMPVWAPAPFYYQAIDPSLMKHFRHREKSRKLRVI